MLWQSSLLIAVLLAVDFLLRRKLRASIRYALWLVVLVKLCLPPTLALPTSPAWWLHQTPPPTAARTMPNFTVTYENPPLPELPPIPLAAYVPPPPAINSASWTLIFSMVVSAALYGWLLVRWWQITRQVRHAATSERLAALAGEAQTIAGMKFSVRVKLTANSMSPAVCGLFRPAILIPQTLAEKFSDEQLRAVLLHELIHLRRRDVWVNFLQALLQIFYWWHPLVWLANARIRAVREEAVDDAVMLALRDEAEAYAPTLLEVAKLALNRPLASLGLVGILESRHALRQRIERLVDFRPPRQAGLTLVSLLGILAFTAVAVPMGGAPEPAETQAAPSAVVAVHPPANVLPGTNQPSILIASEIYQMRGAEFEKIVAGLKFNAAGAGADAWWSASPEKFQELTASLESFGLHPITRPRIQTSSGTPAEMYVGDGTNGMEFDCTPFIAGGRIDLAIAGKIVESKASETSTNQFRAKATVENHGGFVIRTQDVGSSGESNVVMVTRVELVTGSGLQPATGLPASGKPAAKASTTMTFRVDPRIQAAELKEKLLAAGVKIPPTTFFYTHSGMLLVRGSEEQLARVNRLVLTLNGYPTNEIEAASKHFLPPDNLPPSAGEMATNLFARTFRVDPRVFAGALREQTSLQTTDVSALAKSFFSMLGVDLESPKGKAVFFNDRLGVLFVKATEADLDLIEQAVQVLDQVPLQIHIKARFVEVPRNSVSGFTTFLGQIPLTNVGNSSAFPGNVGGTPVPPNLQARGVPATNAQAAQITGILTESNFEAVLTALRSNKDAEILGIPECTTLSGRQAQMRATGIVLVVTNIAFYDTFTNQDGTLVTNAMTPQTSELATGPVLDVVPYVLSDGYTINLTLMPSLTEFLGYDESTNTTAAYNRAGEKIDVPKVLPRFTTWQLVTTLNLWDNQTVILAGLPEATHVAGSLVNEKPKTNDKELLVFITATIVDSAGNRVHAEDELPFAAKGVPPQPPPNK